MKKRVPQLLPLLLATASMLCLSFQIGCEGNRDADPDADLLKAVRRDDLNGIRRATESGADLNRIVDNTTPLIKAIKSGELKSYQLLLELGADPNVLIDDLPASDRLNSAMRAAIGANEMAFLTLALKHGGDPNLTGSKSGSGRLLHTAINYGDYEAFVLLMEKGADITHVTGFGRSLLEYAIASQEYEIAELLVKNGIDPTIENHGGTSPLYFFLRFPITNKGHIRYEGYERMKAFLKERGYIE